MKKCKKGQKQPALSRILPKCTFDPKIKFKALNRFSDSQKTNQTGVRVRYKCFRGTSVYVPTLEMSEQGPALGFAYIVPAWLDPVCMGILGVGIF